MMTVARDICSPKTYHRYFWRKGSHPEHERAETRRNARVLTPSRNGHQHSSDTGAKSRGGRDPRRLESRLSGGKEIEKMGRYPPVMRAYYYPSHLNIQTHQSPPRTMFRASLFM